MATLELVVTVDEDGNFRLAGVDCDGDLMEAFDNLGSDQATRTVRLRLEIDEAKPIELSAKVPADMTSGTVEIKTQG